MSLDCRNRFIAFLVILFTFRLISCNETGPKDIFVPAYTPVQAKKMDSLYALTAHYYRTDPDSAEILYDYLLRSIDSVHQVHQKFYILMDKVEFYQYRKPDFLKSYQNLMEAMSIFISSPDACISSTYSFIDIGNFFFRNKQYDQAIKFYRVAISVSRQYQKTGAGGTALQNIGLVYLSRGNLDSARHYFSLAHDILSDTVYLTEAQNYLYLGKIALKSNQSDSALFFAGKCRQMLSLFVADKHRPSTESKGKFLVAGQEIACKYHTLMYHIYLIRSLYDSSNFHFNQAMSLSLKSQSDYNLTGLYLIKLFNDPVAKEQNASVVIADSCLYYAEKQRDLYISCDIADTIAKFFNQYPGSGLPEKYRRINNYLQDSLNKLLGTQSFTDGRILLSSVVAEQVIRSQNIEKIALREKLYYQRIFMIIGIVFLLGLSGILFFIFRQNRKLHDAYTNLSKRIRESIKNDDSGTEKNPVPPGSSEEIFNRLESLMASGKIHLDKKLTLQELARLLNTNKSYLSVILNNTYETNFNDYINQWRVKEACILLMNPESAKMSMDQVAESAGFNSRSAFYNAFKKFTGMSPAAFIKTIPDPGHKNPGQVNL